jgi:hypothetical protein
MQGKDPFFQQKVKPEKAATWLFEDEIMSNSRCAREFLNLQDAGL